MPSKSPYIPVTAVEATVSSKGQITLPKALRNHLGIQTGSRLRFTLHRHGGFVADRVLLDLEDNWKIADAGPRAKGILSFEKMNEAKSRKIW